MIEEFKKLKSYFVNPDEKEKLSRTMFDQKGAIRGYYEGLVDADADALGRDARRLLEVGS